jgi:hypothetical protein
VADGMDKGRAVGSKVMNGRSSQTVRNVLTGLFSFRILRMNLLRVTLFPVVCNESS